MSMYRYQVQPGSVWDWSVVSPGKLSVSGSRRLVDHRVGTEGSVLLFQGDPQGDNVVHEQGYCCTDLDILVGVSSAGVIRTSHRTEKVLSLRCSGRGTIVWHYPGCGWRSVCVVFHLLFTIDVHVCLLLVGLGGVSPTCAKIWECPAVY